MSLEMFWACEPFCEELSLIFFSDYAVERRRCVWSFKKMAGKGQLMKATVNGMIMRRSVKKAFCWLLTLAMLLCMVPGCGTQTDKEQSTPASQEFMEQHASTNENTGGVNSTESIDAAGVQQSIRYEDTYWTAIGYASYSKDRDDQRDREWMALPASRTEIQLGWWLDLFLFADGSALLRDVQGDTYTAMAMEGTWEADAAGRVKIVSSRYLSPNRAPKEVLPCLRLVDGADPDETGLEGMLALDYYDESVIYFQQAPMPENDLCLCMADLEGDWEMVSTGNLESDLEKVSIRAEGDASDVVGNDFLASISFEESAYGVDAVYTDLSGGFALEFRAFLRYREEPLYQGCGNGTWSVEFDTQGNDMIEDTQLCATLLDRDTLLLQWRNLMDGVPMFNSDGSPSAHYDIYRRSSEIADAISLQESLDEQRAQAPENTMLCVGVNQLTPQSPGVKRLMNVVPLAETDNAVSVLLICPDYAGVRVIRDGVLIYETELWFRDSELLLLDTAESSGSCQLEISPDHLKTWYVWELSEETISQSGWTNIFVGED